MVKLSRRIRKNVKRLKKQFTILKMFQCVSVISFLWFSFCDSLFAEVLRIAFLPAIPEYETEVLQYSLLVLFVVVVIPMLIQSKNGLFYLNFEEDN